MQNKGNKDTEFFNTFKKKLFEKPNGSYMIQYDEERIFKVIIDLPKIEIYKISVDDDQTFDEIWEFNKDGFFHTNHILTINAEEVFIGIWYMTEEYYGSFKETIGNTVLCYIGRGGESNDKYKYIYAGKYIYELYLDEKITDYYSNIIYHGPKPMAISNNFIYCCFV